MILRTEKLRRNSASKENTSFDQGSAYLPVTKQNKNCLLILLSKISLLKYLAQLSAAPVGWNRSSGVQIGTSGHSSRWGIGLSGAAVAPVRVGKTPELPCGQALPRLLGSSGFTESPRTVTLT